MKSKGEKPKSDPTGWWLVSISTLGILALLLAAVLVHLLR